MWDRLPPELVQHILQYLHPKDLCSLALVSRSLLLAATDPRLWRTSRVSKSKLRTWGVAGLMSVARYRDLRILDLSASWLTSRQCQDVCIAIAGREASSVVDVNFSHLDLSEVPASLLGSAVSRLTRVELWNNMLSQKQSRILVDSLVSSISLHTVMAHDIDMALVDNNVKKVASQRFGGFYKDSSSRQL